VDLSGQVDRVMILNALLQLIKPQKTIPRCGSPGVDKVLLDAVPSMPEGSSQDFDL